MLLRISAQYVIGVKRLQSTEKNGDSASHDSSWHDGSVALVLGAGGAVCRDNFLPVCTATSSRETPIVLIRGCQRQSLACGGVWDFVRPLLPCVSLGRGSSGRSAGCPAGHRDRLGLWHYG